MIAAVLTKEMTAMMSADELVTACVAQIKAQQPGLTEEHLVELSFGLFDSFATEAQQRAVGLVGIMEVLDEVVTEEVEATAANLLSPRLRDGKLHGVLAVSCDGEEGHVSIQFATVDHLKHPFYGHHVTRYASCANLLRNGGYDTYAAGYEAGLFTAKEGA